MGQDLYADRIDSAIGTLLIIRSSNGSGRNCAGIPAGTTISYGELALGT